MFPMNPLVAELRRFIANESAATAIEYAMIAAGIGATIASVVWGLGTQLRANWYDNIKVIF